MAYMLVFLLGIYAHESAKCQELDRLFAVICYGMPRSFWNIDNVSVSEQTFFVPYSDLALSVDNIFMILVLMFFVRKSGL